MARAALFEVVAADVDEEAGEVAELPPLLLLAKQRYLSLIDRIIGAFRVTYH